VPLGEETPVRNRYFTAISSSNKRTAANRDTHLLRIVTSTADELSRGTNIDDLEPPK